MRNVNPGIFMFNPLRIVKTMSGQCHARVHDSDVHDSEMGSEIRISVFVDENVM